MTPQELRLGNLVKLHGVVMELRIHDLYRFENKDIVLEFIEINKYRLMECGFHKTEEGFYKIKIDAWVNLEINLTTNRTILFMKKEIKYIELKNLKYIHELQNLYFLLTGHELIFNK